MEIKPRFGIDSFSFGMKKEDIVAKLGKPDKILIDDEEENQLLYQYNKLKLRLTFYEEEEGKLGYIRCADPGLTYQGKQIINQPIEKVKKDVFGKTIQSWEIEDYDFFTTHTNEENWLVLNVEYEEVTDIELGIPFNEDGEYDWK